MSERRTFIITRPEADAARFRRAALAAGHECLASPLLSIRFRRGREIPDRAWRAVAITSANGAKAITAHPARARLTKAMALTVGPASSEAARAAGFSRVLQADGDVRALIAMVLDNLSPDEGPILYASGAITRGDLQGELEAGGFEVFRVALYEAVAAERLSPEAARALKEKRADAVALYSPRSAKIWGGLVRKENLEREASAASYACLSENVARALRGALPGAERVMVPERPDEASLLRALGLAAAD